MTISSFFVSAAPKLDLKYLSDILVVYSKTKSYLDVLKNSARIVTWLAIVIVIPLVISLITILVYLIGDCARCCCMRRSIKARRFRSICKRRTCFWFQVASSLLGIVGCVIVMVGCFQPYTAANGIIQKVESVVLALNGSSQGTATAVDSFLGSIFYDNVTGKPFAPLTEALTQDAQARDEYIAKLQLNASMLSPVLSVLNDVSNSTLAVLRAPVNEWKEKPSDPSLAFLAYLSDVSTAAPAFYSTITTNAKKFNDSLVEAVVAPPVPYGENYFPTGYSFYDKILYYNLFVNATRTVAQDAENLVASLALFVGFTLKDPKQLEDIMKNSQSVTAEQMIFPTPALTAVTVSEFMSNLYSSKLSTDLQGIFSKLVNGTDVYGLMKVMCDKQKTKTPTMQKVCDAFTCKDPATGMAQCLADTSVLLTNIVLESFGVTLAQISSALSENLVKYPGLYFDYTKALSTGLRNLTYKDLSNYFLNQKPCKGQNDAVVMISKLLGLYDDATGFCGVNLEEKFPQIRDQAVLRNIYKILIANPFLYISLLLGLILVVIPALFLAGSLIGLCAKCICCNAFSLTLCFLMPLALCILSLILSVLTIIFSNGVCYNVFDLTFSYTKYMDRNYPSLLPALSAAQTTFNLNLPPSVQEILTTKSYRIDLSAVQTDLAGIIQLPAPAITLDLSQETYSKFAASANLQPIYFYFNKTVDYVAKTLKGSDFPLNISLTKGEPLYDFFKEFGVLISNLDLSNLFAAPGTAAATQATVFSALGVDGILTFLETVIPGILTGLAANEVNFVSTMLGDFLTNTTAPLSKAVNDALTDPNLQKLHVFNNAANYTYHPKNDSSKSLYFDMLNATAFYTAVVAVGVRDKELLGDGKVMYPLFDNLASEYITKHSSSATLPALTYSNNSDGTAGYTMSCNAAFLLECLMTGDPPPPPPPPPGPAEIDEIKAFFTSDGFSQANFPATGKKLEEIGFTHKKHLLACYKGIPTDAIIKTRLEKISAFSSLTTDKKKLFEPILLDAYKRTYFPDLRDYTTAVFDNGGASLTEDASSKLYNSTINILTNISGSAKALPDGSKMPMMQDFARAQIKASEQFLKVTPFVLDVLKYNLEKPGTKVAQPSYPLYSSVAQFITVGTEENPALLPVLYNHTLSGLFHVLNSVVGKGVTLVSPHTFGSIVSTVQAVSCNGLLNIFGELGFGYYLLWLGCYLTLIAMLDNWVYIRMMKRKKGKDRGDELVMVPVDTDAVEVPLDPGGGHKRSRSDKPLHLNTSRSAALYGDPEYVF